MYDREPDWYPNTEISPGVDTTLTSDPPKEMIESKPIIGFSNPNSKGDETMKIDPNLPIHESVPLCLIVRRMDGKMCSKPKGHSPADEHYYNLTTV